MGVCCSTGRPVRTRTSTTTPRCAARHGDRPDYPPVAPAVDWGDTYTTDRFVTTGVDASIIPSETVWYYRVMAYDARGRPVSASPVREARLQEPAGLGDLEVRAGPTGSPA